MINGSAVANFFRELKTRICVMCRIDFSEHNLMEGIEECSEDERQLVELVPASFKPKFIETFRAARANQRETQKIFDQYYSNAYYSEETASE